MRSPLPISDPPSRSGAVRRRARELGFDLVGIAPADPPVHADFLLEWLGRGYDGSMDYLRRPDTIQRRLDPPTALADARSLVMVALNYANGDPGPADDRARPVIARYARGEDYHTVFEEKLSALAEHLRLICGGDARTRPYVDYGPVMERDHAQRAGLGWIGKNTVLIHPELGSYLFLGEILTDAELEPDAAFTPDHCGTCARCIEACPTGAIKAPRELDARLCISYLTIELRGPIPRELRPLIGNRVFGCDICQDVCPWNHDAPATREPRFHPRAEITNTRLIQLMGLTDEDFDRLAAGTALKRAKRRGLLRNVAVALGNWGSPDAVPTLASALDDPEPLIRGHAAWALGRVGTPPARAALSGRLATEPDRWAREELALALRETGRPRS